MDGIWYFITLIPLIIVGVIARLYAKLNYLSLCGLLAGPMTDPPALAFANELKEGSGAAALSYATVHPLTMFLRIISPQLLAILYGFNILQTWGRITAPSFITKQHYDHKTIQIKSAPSLPLSFIQ